MVQVDCSIITSVSIECCCILDYSWNIVSIRKQPLSMSVGWNYTTWPPVSDALESIVCCSISLPNLSDEDNAIVRIDHSLQ